jgi:hypothetical protein
MSADFTIWEKIQLVWNIVLRVDSPYLASEPSIGFLPSRYFLNISFDFFCEILLDQKHYVSFLYI